MPYVTLCNNSVMLKLGTVEQRQYCITSWREEEKTEGSLNNKQKNNTERSPKGAHQGKQ